MDDQWQESSDPGAGPAPHPDALPGTPPQQRQPQQAQGPGPGAPGPRPAGRFQPGQFPPGQFPPGQPRPGQTRLGQPRPGQPRPGQRTQGHIPPGQRPGQRGPGPARKPRRLWIPIVAVAAVLVLLGGIAIWWFSRDTPEKAVERYFRELTFVTSANMREVTDISPGDASRARQLSPLKGVGSITSMKSRGEVVTVTYPLGGSSHTTDIETTYDYAAKKYKVHKGTATLVLRSSTIDRLPLNLSSNEVAVNQPLMVWPGTYRLGSLNSPWIELSSREEFALEPGQNKTLEVVASVNEPGRAQISQSIAAALRECVGPSANQGRCPSALPKAPSDAYWYPVDFTTLSQVNVAPGQPLDKVCGTGTLSMQLNNRRTLAKGPVTPIPYQGCFDIREPIRSSTVKWL